jgi:dCMP deaminase
MVDAAADGGKRKRVGKRQDYLGWDDYFMAVAFLSANRSKDPSTQVGACIVNEERKIVGIGYNGMPNGCSDDELPWAREADSPLDTKYPYVCHAELNAIMNKNSADVKGCRLFVALFPCNECAKLIIQSGIREVVYMSDKHRDQVPPVCLNRATAHLCAPALPRRPLVREPSRQAFPCPRDRAPRGFIVTTARSHRRAHQALH